MSLEQRFNEAAENVKKLKTSPPNNDLLELYGLFKQSTVGDCETNRPGMLDMKGRAKWDAWMDRKGMLQDEAKEKYVISVESLIRSIGVW